MKLNQVLNEAIERTGKNSTAVVGWGRGMGHKGHMFLASAVISKAKEISADPYFVVSRTVGFDDPIKPEEKLSIYKKVFPSSANIFQVATDEMPDLTRVLSSLNKQGYKNVVVIVGADQVNALSYVKNYNNKPDKAGNILYTFDSLDVIARQEVTSDPGSKQEGPRATPMRQILLDPTKSDAEKFAVWRDAMNPEISDNEVRELMKKAELRMKTDFAPKAKKAKKESIDVDEAKRKKRKRKVNPYWGYYYGGTNDSGEAGGDAGGGESVGEAWSDKYKRSIDCNNPKGFSQRAHCAGRKKRSTNENFADGKGPGRSGDSQRQGIPKGASIAQLEKHAKRKGRAGQLARWQLNMRRGKKSSSVNEIANNPYRYLLAKKTSEGSNYIFQTENGSRFNVLIEKQLMLNGGTKATIGFADVTEKNNPTIDITNKGDSFRIFATIQAIVQDFLKNNKPTMLRFYGKSKDASRIKLYDKIAQKIGNYLSDYTFDRQASVGDEKMYIFKRAQTINVDESEKVSEVSMSPGALKDFAATPFAQSMTAGFEAELIIPNVRGDEDSYESEPDYDMDERISGGWDDIRDFFVGDYNTRRTVDRAIEEMQEEFFSDASDVFSEEMQDEIIDYIRAAAKDDGMSQKEIDAMIEDPNDNSDYEKYMDNAREELESDFFDTYFDTWIRRNYPRMSNVSQNLNLDWPYWTSPSGDIGELEIADVAVEIQDAIGMRVKGSSGYHSAKRGTDYFILEPDSSIEADESEGEGGLELVSPPMPLAQCLEYLDSVFKWANAYGCRTDSSTGFHMGISIPGQTMENVDHLKFTLFLGDEYVLKQFGRESNTFARSMYKRIRSDVQRSSGTEPGTLNPEALLNAFRRGMNTIAADTIKRLLTSGKDRYVTVNIKENYIEVRSAGGDYLGDLDKIKNTLLRYVRAMGLAADPEAEKQEYAKKLYKLLASTMQPGEEDIIKYFSQYSAGTLPATALKSFIRQVQQKRADKKGGVTQAGAYASAPATTGSSIGDTSNTYRMVDRNNGYLASVNADNLFDAYTRARRIATTAQLASNAWRLIDSNGQQVWPDPGTSSATTSSPASTAGTYVITYRSPTDGEQRTAIDANSASEAEEWFKSNHPSTYQILNVSTPIPRR